MSLTFIHCIVIMVMRWLKILSLALALVLVMAGCSSDNLEKMIPADATGVVSIDVPRMLKVADMLDGDEIVLPKSLLQAIDDNDTSPFCVLLNDLPAAVIRSAVHDDIFDVRIILSENRKDGLFDIRRLVERRCDNGY